MVKVSTHTKNQLMGTLDQVCGFGLKVGVPIFVVAAVYLLLTVFGGHTRNVAAMSPLEKKHLADGIALALQALNIASIVVIAALVVRYQGIEATGQALSIIGAILYFGSPAGFALGIHAGVAKNTGFLLNIVAAFRQIGVVCLLPGLVLVLRDAIMRIWTGVSVRRIMERRWGDEDECRRKAKPVLYAKCWEMSFCREFVRKVCPAYESRKSCWRVKVGCYCDEKTILRAMTSQSNDNIHVRGIMDSLGLNKPGVSRLSMKLKRQRCRRCGIYAEHQRQKYRLLSPLVFPGVGVLLYTFYDKIALWVGVVMTRTNEFMSFLSYKSATSSADAHFLTTCAIAWLTIIAISYALRALEYLVFELQV